MVFLFTNYFLMGFHTIHCQVVIPLGKHEGFPISVSLISYHGADKFLLDTVLDMYSSLQEQVTIASNLVHEPDSNGNIDASELLKEKVCPQLIYFPTPRLMLYLENIYSCKHTYF